METNQISYSGFVRNLAKPGQEIVSTMTPSKADIMHMTMGICGEAGELLDAVKKHVIYGKDLDFKNLREELGDIEFYLQGIRNAMNISREEIIVENIKKLSKRYRQGYSDQAAISREDKL